MWIQTIAFISFRSLAVTLLLLVLMVISPSAMADSFRILHITSYQEAWEWSQDQFNGFKSELSELDIEYKVFEMDTKNHPDQAWKEQKSREALALIDSWKPDLVYANDDNAQKYVGRHLVGSQIPVVFSGVNADPATYGYVGSPNVTGVLEVEHSRQTIDLLRQIKPDIRRIALIVDQGPTWPSVVTRFKDALAGVDDVEIVAVSTPRTFAHYRELIQNYQDTVDALGVLGVFGLTDENGDTVPFDEVLRWTTENSKLPDFSFWGNRIKLGTLSAVRVSGWAQGQVAGEMARRILTREMQPHQINMVPTLKGKPVISLARARQLNLSLPTSLLLNASVIKAFSWESVAEYR